MIPYFQVSDTQFGPFHFHVFSVLLIAAILTGFAAATLRAGQAGISREKLARISLCMVAFGALGAFAFKFAYRPDLLILAPSRPLWLLRHLPGLSSFGGFFGGLAGALLLFHFSKCNADTRLRYLDAVGFALPFGWSIGRAGCALVHDHPGLRSSSFLAVAYPGGARFDLGLLECLFLISMAALFSLLARRPRPNGFFFALFFVIYGPFRLLLDQLHVDPPRYLGWSVDQYCGFTALLIAACTVFYMSRHTGLRISSPGKTTCSPLASISGTI